MAYDFCFGCWNAPNRLSVVWVTEYNSYELLLVMKLRGSEAFNGLPELTAAD
jgi:hypothetical protein